MRDCDGDLIYLLCPSFLPIDKLEVLSTQVQNALPEEWEEGTSDTPDYEYLSWHGSWYNRFAEKVSNTFFSEGKNSS